MEFSFQLVGGAVRLCFLGISLYYPLIVCDTFLGNQDNGGSQGVLFWQKKYNSYWKTCASPKKSQRQSCAKISPQSLAKVMECGWWED